MRRSCITVKKFEDTLKLNDCQLTGSSNYVGIDAEPIKTFDSLLLDYLDRSKTLWDLISEPYVIHTHNKSLYEMVNVDFSSKACPQILGRTETSFEDDVELSDEKIISKLVKSDCTVNMPPRNNFTVRANIVSMKKVSPPVFEK